MTLPTFDQFREQALAEGFDEVFERVWQAGVESREHTHPFDVSGLVVDGDMVLRCGGEERRLGPGDRFQVGRGTPHAERYGAVGARYWAARRS